MVLAQNDTAEIVVSLVDMETKYCLLEIYSSINPYFVSMPAKEMRIFSTLASLLSPLMPLIVPLRAFTHSCMQLAGGIK